MRVEILSDGSVQLREVEDFQRFSVAPAFQASELERIREKIAGVAIFESDDVAWVTVEAIRDLAGDREGAWDRRFRDMLEKVEPLGWFNDERRVIRAHVVWP